MRENLVFFEKKLVKNIFCKFLSFSKSIETFRKVLPVSKKTGNFEGSFCLFRKVMITIKKILSFSKKKTGKFEESSCFLQKIIVTLKEVFSFSLVTVRKFLSFSKNTGNFERKSSLFRKILKPLRKVLSFPENTKKLHYFW